MSRSNALHWRDQAHFRAREATRFRQAVLALRTTTEARRRPQSCIVDHQRPREAALVSCCHARVWPEGASFGDGATDACEMCSKSRCMAATEVRAWAGKA